MVKLYIYEISMRPICKYVLSEKKEKKFQIGLPATDRVIK